MSGFLWGNGTNWTYLSFNDSSDNWMLQLQSSVPYDLYISEKESIYSDPNPFDYDSQFLNMTPNRNFTLVPGNLKYNNGFVVAVKLHAFNTAKNSANPFEFSYRFYNHSSNFTDAKMMSLRQYRTNDDEIDQNVLSF